MPLTWLQSPCEVGDCSQRDEMRRNEFEYFFSSRRQKKGLMDEEKLLRHHLAAAHLTV